MSNPLTAGAIQKILLNPDNLPKNPVLQVLGLKKVQASQASATERYRMVLSDGIHAHTCAMLATQLNSMVHNEELDIKAVVQLDKYICNTIQETRKVLIVLELTVIKRGSVVQERYGDPKVYGEQTDGQSNVTSNQTSRPSVQRNAGNFSRNQQPSSGSRFGSNQAPVSRNPNMPAVFPISSLNPYLNRWTICARVTSKTNIRTWSNSRGDGKLFSVDLIDESGEIRATCFTDLVDRFYDLLEPNKVYYISKGTLKAANKKYTSLKNDYELQFNSDTSIELCTDNDSLPTLQFNFCDIAKIQDVQPDHLTDVIGVCTSIAAVSEITVRSTGKQVPKRDITLLDSTASVSCTLWGTEAENFEKYVGTNPIIAIKGAKVSDFGGRSLSLLNSSVMQVNPDDLQEAFKLRGWYDSVGSSENIASISGQRGEGISTNVYKMVRDIKEEGLGMSEKPDYFNIIATVHYFRKENCLYKACPKAECNKKVVEDGDHYRCEKCNQSFPNFKHRLLLRANICDHTGDQWVTCFQDSAELLLSKTADEVGQLQEMDEKAFEQFFNEKTFQTVTLRVRAKMDKYNDEARIQCTADKVTPVDFCKESKRLMEEIDKMV